MVVTPADDDADLVQAAARNNAELCEVVCRSHGLAGVFASGGWTSPRRTPPYYPDAVTIDPSADAAQLLVRIDPAPGASVKDSFATLDLTPHGFRILFSAEWIARRSGSSSRAGADDRIRWSAVADAQALAAWEAAWSEDGTSHGLFRPELLSCPELVVLGGEVGGALVAGAILNRSERVVGVSNLFTSTGDPDGAWSRCVDEASARFPDLAIVGYESGAMLDAASRAGFRSMGPLRVWIND